MAKKATKPKKQVLKQAKPAATQAKPVVAKKSAAMSTKPIAKQAKPAAISTKPSATQAIDFKSAFKYPFNRPKGMLNILWVFLPILGWFALMGYSIRIVKNFINNDFKELPLFSLGDDFKLGFFMFIKMLPLIIVLILINVILTPMKGFGSFISILISTFVFPILVVNFFNKETVSSSFELDKVRPVFEHFWDYIIVLLKSIGLAIIFLIMSLILVGIPASTFTKNLFLADFYRRFAK